jgi:hypothetical protein
MKYYVVERKLEFKTVKPRWEPQSLCDTLTEAQERLALLNRCAQEHGFGRSPGGGQITEYRIKNC